MKNFLLFGFLIISANWLNGQNTVGLIDYDITKSFDGYNLIYPEGQPNIYLLNNCGEIAHTWTDASNFVPGNSVYLLENGNIVKTKTDKTLTDDSIVGLGGNGETIEIRDWDNNLVYSFTLNDAQFRLHHDFVVMPNGNILATAWERKNLAECIQAGRDSLTMIDDELWPEMIIEIDPNLDSVVWEWHAWDHLVQDLDNTKDNFANVGTNVGKININWNQNNGKPDWLRLNSIDYNELLDQILVSSPFFGEIWIIDHSTTTSQAAGSTGGTSNRGGDLLYRWGNPQAYNKGDSTDQKIFFGHSAHWVDNFVKPGNPQFGKIALFNNRIGDDFSAMSIITPPWDMYSNSYLIQGGTYLPNGVDKNVTHPNPTELFSHIVSNAQVLPNGNYFLFSGLNGKGVEITSNDEVVWEYIIPLNMGMPASQGDNLMPLQNLTFRMTRYPADYAGFDARDLSNKGFIELNPDTAYCQQLISSIDPVDDMNYKAYPNPTSDFLTLEWDGMHYADIEITNLLGQVVSKHRCSGGRTYLDVSAWENGIYLVTIDKRYTKRLVVQN